MPVTCQEVFSRPEEYYETHHTNSTDRCCSSIRTPRCTCSCQVTDGVVHGQQVVGIAFDHLPSQKVECSCIAANTQGNPPTALAAICAQPPKLDTHQLTLNSIRSPHIIERAISTLTDPGCTSTAWRIAGSALCKRVAAAVCATGLVHP